MKIIRQAISGLLLCPLVAGWVAVRGYGVPAGKPRQVRKEATVVRPALP